MLHSQHWENVQADQYSVPRQESTEHTVEAFYRWTHPEISTHHITYGTSSTPFLATRCLKKIADDSQANHPRAAQVLGNDFYIDDLSGASKVKEAIKLQDLSSLLQGAGFTVRKWASTHSEFLDTIPLELQETQTTLSLDNDNEITLGLQW
jgi:hypothetical protein